MKYTERKDRAKEMVVEFLDAYASPRGISDRGQAQVIENIADAFARRMPTSGDFADAVRAVFLRIRDTHLSSTWPTQAVFVMAMPQRETTGPTAQETWDVDEAKIYRERMLEGAPVPESWVWGIKSSYMPTQELDAYRETSVNNWLATYKTDAESLMIARWGGQVSQYFSKLYSTGGAA